MRILITGCSGFYGELLVDYLKEKGVECYGIDMLQSKNILGSNFIEGNILSTDLNLAFKGIAFDAIIHLATMIDFAVESQENLFENNVQSTKKIINFSLENGCKRIVFTSSNSIYLGSSSRFISDETVPVPQDLYGESKYLCEKLLKEVSDKINISIIRCPIIIDAGRVGMLSILFELIESDATLWVLGGGLTKHQCIYAHDLSDAIFKVLHKNGLNIYNIGCDNVVGFREIFLRLVKTSGKKSKVRSFPLGIAIALLKICYQLKISPIGPYQFRMLSSDFVFDTRKIKKELEWVPTKNNAEVLQLAFDHYRMKKKNGANAIKSANSSTLNLGILKLLRYIKF